MMLLVPSDVLRRRRPDEHFAPEANAAREAGIGVALVDHEALIRGATERAVARVPEGSAVAIYRGWMLRSEQYGAFAEALAERGVTMRTSAEQYRRAHELPGWYAAAEAVTPASVWTDGTDRRGFDHAISRLASGPAVLRDYSKSMKHYWHEAAFIPELADAEAAWAVASRFRELREEDLVGGFVLRRFERFVGSEVRTWWIEGDCQIVGPHPDTPDDPVPTDLDLSSIRPIVAGLQLPFVTVDLAPRADRSWRVIELGDGQVSDWPAAMPHGKLVAALGSSLHVA